MPRRAVPNGAVPRLVFPLVAKTDLWDDYGDPRPNGRHAGIDMENPARAVVAVEDGSIKYWVSSLGGCMLYLYGRSGTTYMYIHLNNDLTARNDNKGGCVNDVSFSVPNGAKVTAGQQIAWNGDSGDANGNPHLHFEVHPNDGADVDPFRYLKRAMKPLFAARSRKRLQPRAQGKARRSRRRGASVPIDRVRRYPGGGWLDVDPREVELAVPLGTDVSPFDSSRAPRSASSRSGDRHGVHPEGERNADRNRRCARRAPARQGLGDAVGVGRTSPLGVETDET